MRSLTDVNEAGPRRKDVAQCGQHVFCQDNNVVNLSRLIELLEAWFTSECLHPLGSAAHADILHIPEHLLEVVGARAECEVVQHVLLHVLDVRVGELHLVPVLAPVSCHER